MKTAVLYARVSSKEQEREGFSIPAQLKLLREYAARNDFRLAREFVDVETAKTTGRQNFEEMVKFFKHDRGCRILLVEKTDRLYRNLKDAVTLEDLDLEIHLVKEGQVISKEAKSQTKLIHGMHLVLARHYIENLREEVKKGMREKAEQGMYPGRAPFGYRNNTSERKIEIHSQNAPIAMRIFELYASGKHSLSELRRIIRAETGKVLSRAHLHTTLTNPFYVGNFLWGGKLYRGTHDIFIDPTLFDRVQAVLAGHNKPKYCKQEIAFRGLLTCAEDNCAITAERKKGKYVYYRCTGYRGRCATPRFREEEISAKLGEVLKGIHIPDEVLAALQQSLTQDHVRLENQSAFHRASLVQRLAALRKRMDQAYQDKLDGKIPEDFWERKMSEWRAEEQQIQMTINQLQVSSADRVLSATRILELANKAYSLYLTQKPAEQAKLLRLVLLNCSIDKVSIYPAYRKPFDLIFQRTRNEQWSGRADLNCRPLAPQASALPG